eukprot:1542858-Pyramimonas_sp.AAC.3
MVCQDGQLGPTRCRRCMLSMFDASLLDSLRKRFGETFSLPSKLSQLPWRSARGIVQMSSTLAAPTVRLRPSGF